MHFSETRFWWKNSFSHYVFAGFVHIGWKEGVQLSTRQLYAYGYIYIYIYIRFVTWLPATDPLPHTARHIEQPPPRAGADCPLVTIANWPKTAENDQKWPKFGPHLTLRRGMVGGQSGWPGGLCGWVCLALGTISQDHFSTPNQVCWFYLLNLAQKEKSLLRKPDCPY